MLHSDCIDENTLAEMFEGLLSEAAKAEVDAHIARCSECRQLISEVARSASFDGNSPTAPAIPGEAHITIEPGQIIGRFEVLSRIGRGGMGVVFAAYDPRLDRKVALKLLRNAGDGSVSADEAQARLEREAQSIARLSHPNVITVYDVGTYLSEVYIAMQFVEGDTLTNWLRRWERPWRDIVQKFRIAGQALAAAHAAGLIHRDFKPDNVMVGEDEQVWVMDFGLARSLFIEALAPEPRTSVRDRDTPLGGVRALSDRLTETGALLGTPRYMAPEQFRGHAADARSDQFSYCVSMYEALYNQHPFSGGTAEGLVDDPDNHPPRDPPANTDVPRWLHQVLLRGMQRDPKDRYPSMNALLQALSAPPATKRRFRALALAAAALLALSTVGYAIAAYIDMVQERDELRDRIEHIEDELAHKEVQIERVQRALQSSEQKSGEERERLIAQKEQLIAERDDLKRELEEQKSRQPTIIARPTRPQPPGAQPLRASTIIKRVQTVRRDIEVCFAEWRERDPDGSSLFAMRVEIDPGGAVRPDSKSGGIDDQVIRECVGGALKTVSFPANNASTVVEFAFRIGDTGDVMITPHVREARPVGESL